jgi:ABC-type multidrug transport system fused ATPase/permease subunit
MATINEHDKLQEKSEKPEKPEQLPIYSKLVFDKLFWSYLHDKRFFFYCYIIVITCIWLIGTYGINYAFSQLSMIAPTLSAPGSVGDKAKREQKMWNLIAVFILLSLLSNAFKYIKGKLSTSFYADYTYFLRIRIFSETVNAYVENFRNIKFGTFISRMLAVVANMRGLLQSFVEEFTLLFIGVIVQMVYLYSMNQTLGIIATVSIFLSFGIVWIYSTNIIKLVNSREREFIRINENLSDKLENLLNIYLNNEMENEIEETNLYEKQAADAIKEQFNYMTHFRSYSKIFTLIFISVTVYYSSLLLVREEITPGNYVALVLILRTYSNFFDLILERMPEDIFVKMAALSTSYNFLESILRERENNDYANVTLTQTSQQGKVEFKNVTFAYHGSGNNNDDTEDTNNILENFDLTLTPGEKIVVFGRSGSGKSTLMKLLLKLYTYYEGDIYINDVNIRTLNPIAIRKYVNYVNQNTILHNETVMDNILFGNEPRVKEADVLQLLEKYGLDVVYDGLEKGVYTNANTKGSNLSMGMQKITLLMRGIFKQGKIIIFDEPLTALDKTTGAKVVKMIMEECKDKTVVIISHTDEFNSQVDKVIDLNKEQRKKKKEKEHSQ